MLIKQESEGERDTEEESKKERSKANKESDRKKDRKKARQRERVNLGRASTVKIKFGRRQLSALRELEEGH